MKRNEKSDEKLCGKNGKLLSNSFKTLFSGREHLMLTSVVEAKYTTQEGAV